VIEIVSTAASVSASANVYRGIRYGMTTAKEQRWKDASPAGPWQGVLKAVKFGASCPQPTSPSEPDQSEDCLFLNIWTPTTATASSQLPVIVFIHGGAFRYSSGRDPLFDAAYTAAQQNAVVVTLNYRLGALGFLAGIHGLQGNYGFTDQQLALNWVKANIDGWGGDSNNVTLWGQSSGAMSAALHLASAPGSQSLFSRAVLESATLSFPYDTPTEASLLAGAFQASLGCIDLPCLRSRPVAAVVNAMPLVVSRDPEILLPVWMPVVDGTTITTQPMDGFKAGAAAKSVLFGTTRDEGMVMIVADVGQPAPVLPAFRYAATVYRLFGPQNASTILSEPDYMPLVGDNEKVLAKLLNDYFWDCGNRIAMIAGGGKRFAYRFDKVSSFTFPKLPACGRPNVVCHGSDLPYIFHTFGNTGLAPNSSEMTLAQQLNGFIGCFAAKDDPNPSGSCSSTAWPDFSPSEERLVFDDALSLTTGLASNRCDLWDQIGYDGLAFQLPWN